MKRSPGKTDGESESVDGFARRVRESKEKRKGDFVDVQSVNNFLKGKDIYSMSIETAVFIGYITGFLMAWKVLPWIRKKLSDKEK